MFKKTLTISILVASALMILPVLADTTTTNNIIGTSKITATQIACVGVAVNAREVVTSTAFSSYARSVQLAYAIRATDLQKAYMASNVKDARGAVKAAWNVFKSTTKTANRTWRSSRDTAWKTFRAAVKACRAPSSITDTGNAASEMVGR